MHEVDEVTNLTDNPPATFVRIVDPMIARDLAGVYSIIDRKRRLTVLEEFFCAAC